jgi:hypothetical protein
VYVIDNPHHLVDYAEMSENLKQQVRAELSYHQQEVSRLTKVLELLGEAAPQIGDIAVYKKRRQTPESKARISTYQKRKWETIRAVQSGAVTMESLTPDQQDMIKHVAGINIHPAPTQTQAASSSGNWNPVLVKPTEAGTGLPHAAIPQEPSRDVTKSKAKRLRTR